MLLCDEQKPCKSKGLQSETLKKDQIDLTRETEF